MTSAWKERPDTPPTMDKHQKASAASPGYETRDANARGVFNFLVFLGLLLVVSVLLCWGLFRYFSRQQAGPAGSPFEDTRELPLGPQLQVNPREDWLKFHEQQEQSLETFGWQNRGAGIARVPIERAMDLLVQKGLPVQDSSSPPATPAATPATTAKKPEPQAEKKP
jgi:hypothetical protein